MDETEDNADTITLDSVGDPFIPSPKGHHLKPDDNQKDFSEGQHQTDTATSSIAQSLHDILEEDDGECSYKQWRKIFAISLGMLKALAGLLCVVCGYFALQLTGQLTEKPYLRVHSRIAKHELHFGYMGYGIWCGVIYTICGSYVMVYYAKRNLCKARVLMFVLIVTLLFTTIMISLSAKSVDITSWHTAAIRQHYSTNATAPDWELPGADSLFAMDCVLLATASVTLVMVIVQVYFACEESLIAF